MRKISVNFEFGGDAVLIYFLSRALAAISCSAGQSCLPFQKEHKNMHISLLSLSQIFK